MEKANIGIWPDKTVELDGRAFQVGNVSEMPQWRHKIDRHLFGEAWDRIQSEILHHYLGENDIFLDIGANWGAYSFLAAPRTQGFVFAFEPHSHNYELLRANTGQFPNVLTFPVALGAHSGLTWLYETSGNCGGHFIDRHSDRSDNRIPAMMLRLDDFNICPDMVKIDAEGYGAEIYIGGITTFLQTRIVMVELHPDRDSQTHSESMLVERSREMQRNVYKFGNKGLVITENPLSLDSNIIRQLEPIDLARRGHPSFKRVGNC